MSYSIGIPEALISLAPGAEWSMTDNNKYSSLVWMSSTPKPTEAEVNAEIARLRDNAPLKLCSDQAKVLLAASDWSVLPDVNISNKAEFEVYRAQLRTLVFTPVVNPVFPTEPQQVWI
jgi:hypothetical protein